LASTAPSKPSSVVKTGLLKTKTSARAGIPDITGCVVSITACMIEPPVKYSRRGRPATTFRTGRCSAFAVAVAP